MQEGQHGRDEHLCLLPAALGVHEAHVDTLEKAELIETRHAGTWSIERGDLCVVPDEVRDLCCDAVAARKALEGKVEANWQEPAVDEDPFGSKRQALPLTERARRARSLPRGERAARAPARRFAPRRPRCDRRCRAPRAARSAPARPPLRPPNAWERASSCAASFSPQRSTPY